MDIIYQLPFPYELCDKIFIFACKSPHTGLGVANLKKKLGVKNLNIPENDNDVVSFISLYFTNYYPRKIPIDLYFYTCLTNLIEIELFNSNLIGNIEDLKSLKNLTMINFWNTNIKGDIQHLKSLQNLTWINLCNTDVTGDIVHLKSIPKLSEVRLEFTVVTGNIEHLKSMVNLIKANLKLTGVLGDKNAFHEYRKKK